MKNFSILTALVILFLFISSCGPALPVIDGYSSKWKFYDIAPPGGLTDGYDYFERESFSYTARWWKSLRIGRAKFVGETRRDSVAHRYRTDLPRKGYSLIRELNDDDLEKTELTFYHSLRDEELNITITRRGPESKIYVEIDVLPHVEEND